jgi:hypothetical protein
MTVGGEARMALSVPVLAKALRESCHRFSDLAICSRASACLQFGDSTAQNRAFTQSNFNGFPQTQGLPNFGAS